MLPICALCLSYLFYGLNISTDGSENIRASNQGIPDHKGSSIMTTGRKNATRKERRILNAWSDVKHARNKIAKVLADIEDCMDEIDFMVGRMSTSEVEAFEQKHGAVPSRTLLDALTVMGVDAIEATVEA